MANDTRHRKTPTIGDDGIPSRGRDALDSSSFDATLPPMPVDRLLAAGGVEICVLSHDADLTESVDAAGGDQFSAHVVANPEKLRVLVANGRCGIAVLDADLLGRELRKLIADLKAIEPALVIVIAAPRETAEELVGLLSERTIHRLLIKPAAHGITRLLLESAVSRYLEIREQTNQAAPIPIRAPKRRTMAQANSHWPAWILAIAFVAVLLGVVFIGGLTRLDPWGTAGPGEGAPAARAFPEPADAGAVPEGGVAGRAIPSGDAEEPERNSAPGAGAAPATAPAPAEAAARVEAAPPARPEPVPSEVLRREPIATESVTAPVADAEREAAAAEPATPEPAATEPAATEPAATEPAAREPVAAAASPPAAQREPAPIAARTLPQAAPPPAVAPPVVRPPSEIDNLLAVAWTRLRQNQIVTPPGDSARDHVERALALDPANVDALILRAEVAAAVAEAARVAIASGDLAGGERLADDAFRLGAETETLAMLDLDLATAREAAAARAQAETLAQGIASMREDRLIAPEGDNAWLHLRRVRAENPNLNGLAAAWRELGERLARNAQAAIADGDWSRAETWLEPLEQVAGVSAAQPLRDQIDAERRQAEYLATPAAAGELRVLASSPAIYPAEAQRRNIEGWVDVEFVVGADGLPRDARVVGAEPTGWFEQAALASVALYRYEPFRRDGRVYERRAQLRIRFGLE
jgi:TonB family protein